MTEPRFYWGRGLHLSHHAHSMQLTGSFLRSDINRDSQVPLIQAHIACKFSLINLKHSQKHVKCNVVRRPRSMKWERWKHGLINHTKHTDASHWSGSLLFSESTSPHLWQSLEAEVFRKDQHSTWGEAGPLPVQGHTPVAGWNGHSHPYSRAELDHLVMLCFWHKIFQDIYQTPMTLTRQGTEFKSSPR